MMNMFVYNLVILLLLSQNPSNSFRHSLVLRNKYGLYNRNKNTHLISDYSIRNIKSVPISIASSTTKVNALQGLFLWLGLFALSAIMHSAESAITKISPWKVQQFAEEEGPTSPFMALSKNITRLLITILFVTTACSIYSTALFVATMTQLFPNISLGAITATLTAITLFFGELLPKALAVSNCELVARKLVPFISRLATVLLPFTSTITFLSDLVLQNAGMRSEEDRNVSEDMLRMVVDEATASSEGIETGEGKMIKAVLDMQDKEVSKIMQPRVDIVALPESASATQILEAAVRTKYSRIPVYRGDIDHIVGVVFSKDLLDYIQVSEQDKVPNLAEDWKELTASKLLENTYYIPETMSCSNALQEMKKRRIHMAIVVDEYGGTSGLITFEDILEEVVGEIYDEDDDEEQGNDNKTIFKRSNGSFKMKGNTELDDVCEALGINLETAITPTGEYSTVGGLLCAVAGMIPKAGDQVEFAGFGFTVLEVEENRRINSLIASPISSIAKSDSDSNNNHNQKFQINNLSESNYNSEDKNKIDNNQSEENKKDYFDNLLASDSNNNNDIKVVDSVNDVNLVGEVSQPSVGDVGDVLIFRDGEWFEPEVKQ